MSASRAEGALRNALQALARGDMAAANAELDGIIAASPAHGPALVLRARLARLGGDIATAESLLERARQSIGDHPQLVNEYGYIALARGDMQAAVRSFERLVELQPTFADGHFNLGQAHAACGRPQLAVSAFERALELDVRGAHQVHTECGFALLDCGRESRAREQFQRALELHAGYPRALFGLGIVATSLGEFDAAHAHYRRALAGDPRMADAYVQLVGARKFSAPDDPDIVAMRDLLATLDGDASDASKLNFALGKALDDCGEYAQAFAHFRRANELRRRGQPAYDPARREHQVSEVIDVFSASFVRAADWHTNPSSTPILVVGMPRSGTTLVEQILASHSHVEAAGELTFFDHAARTQLRPYPQSLRTIDAATLETLAGDYLALLERVAGGQRVSDKFPANFLHLGLIAKLFPAATLIHCRRNPLDTCLSIYFQDFVQANSYANRLRDCAHYYSQYQRVMKHWHEVLGARLISVDYEDLVTDSDAQIRQLLDRAGLPFEALCLTPAARRGRVATLSRWQVRQPIYQSSTQRWRHYAAHLTELAQTLGVELS